MTHLHFSQIMLATLNCDDETDSITLQLTETHFLGGHTADNKSQCIEQATQYFNTATM